MIATSYFDDSINECIGTAFYYSNESKSRYDLDLFDNFNSNLNKPLKPIAYFYKSCKETLDILDEISNLEENWDGYGGYAIPKATINNTLNLLMKFLSKDDFALIPEITPTSAGTISLSWDDEDKECYLEIGIKTFSGSINIREFESIYISGDIPDFNFESFNLLMQLNNDKPNYSTTVSDFSLFSEEEDVAMAA